MPEHFKVYEQTYPHFITNTIVYWIPVFRRDDYFKCLTDSLIYCIDNKGLLVHAYVLMPDHYHLICSQRDGKLSSVIGDTKKHTSKELSRKLAEDGRQLWLDAMRRASGNDGGTKVWQDAFHPEQVHSKPFFEQKLAYIHNNPVRAGYVDDPCHWKYSSAGFYYQEQESIIPIDVLEL